MASLEETYFHWLYQQQVIKVRGCGLAQIYDVDNT